MSRSLTTCEPGPLYWAPETKRSGLRSHCVRLFGLNADGTIGFERPVIPLPKMVARRDLGPLCGHCGWWCGGASSFNIVRSGAIACRHVLVSLLWEDFRVRTMPTYHMCWSTTADAVTCRSHQPPSASDASEGCCTSFHPLARCERFEHLLVKMSSPRTMVQ